MALVKTTRRAHGPTIYILELTEAEAYRVRAVLELAGFEDDAVAAGLDLVLPGTRPLDEVLAEIDAEEAAPAEDFLDQDEIQ